MSKNEDIRSLMKQSGVKQWEIAKATGINEATLSRKLTREELTASEKEKIIEAIEAVQKERARGYIGRREQERRIKEVCVKCCDGRVEDVKNCLCNRCPMWEGRTKRMR